jgi:hypothetical protein
MEKTSGVDLDTTVKMIMENEIGIVLLEAGEESLYSVLAEKTTYEDRQGMYGNGYYITYHLYPLMYKNKNMVMTQDLIKCRANAVQNVFTRWNELGYNKRHAKSPFNSKGFSEYLDSIGFTKADYMLLMVE